MKTYEAIYKRLSRCELITGEQLAKELHLSRTAIWKGIKTLEEQQVIIEAVKKKGYRIVSGDILLADDIAKALSIEVKFNKNSKSTQTDAKSGCLVGSKAPQLYLASTQTEARGRLGRPFFADQTGGIYMTLHLQPNAEYKELPPYTILVASSIVKAINRLTGKDSTIKWVNDIFVNKKKIAGILSETITSVETGLVTDVFIGVGINFNIKTFPQELQEIATSLFFDDEPNITRNDLIIEIWKLFFTIPEKDHVKIYKEKSLVLNKQVTFTQNGKLISALVTDITDHGHLILQTNDHKKMILTSGEVSLSSW